MTFNEILNKYQQKGNFTFQLEEDFTNKCNAPKDAAGVYLIYSCIGPLKNLLYIGSSGRKDSDGNLKVRKGGLYDRLVNGYHPNRFGLEKRIRRKYAFPMQMKEVGIDKIGVYWWVTFDSNNTDIPTDVERKLESKYKSINDCQPPWHQEK